ncbi:MAG TPA: hypothetical protein PK358_10150 [Spirochaetota bacterium]|nr:hypothetical protein [Spirochaetota bacterium]HPJ35186.1 hypothetical protein [Spirochaetota bacterium]
MFEKFIPVFIALIALQFIIRFMQKRKNKVQESEWRKIDYKKRIDSLMKGRDPDAVTQAPRGITLVGLEDYSAIPEDMRGIRKDINHIREAVSIGLRAKIGRDVSVSRFDKPEEMFDEILEVIRKHELPPEA